MVATGAKAQTTGNEKPTIVFVHGIWADGSCWTNQIAALQAKGYHVISVQNPITSLAKMWLPLKGLLTWLRAR